MLTDIFAVRYEAVPLFRSFGRREKRLLHQCFTILEDLHPYWHEEKDALKKSTKFWKTIHKRVSNELGEMWLSDPYYQTEVGLGEFRRTESRQRPELEICRHWVRADVSTQTDVDEFVKERLSLMEVGLREVFEEIEHNKLWAESSPELAAMIASPRKMRALNYTSASSELNERFVSARLPLHYHNGYIQLLSDDKITLELEQPFWSAVSEPIWENVDLDIKEAIDQRDTGGKDPALYAAKALESALKIISDELKVTHGGERGAHSFIDNLGKKDVSFVNTWEADFLRLFFTKVRNQLGHGPGSEPMPRLTFEQSSWAIENAMSWTRLLVQRYEKWSSEELV